MKLRQYIQEQAKIAHAACDHQTLGPFNDNSLIECADIFSTDSEQEITAGLAVAERRLKLLKQYSVPAAFLLLVFIVSGGVFFGVAGVVVCLIISMGAYGFGLEMGKEELAQILSYGRPLVSTGRCVKLQELTKKQPEVALYVRTVTKYRQLYFFDYVLAYGLNEHYQAVSERNREAQENKEACLALHSGASQTH